MSDAKLRDLERTWRRTNDPQDGALLLRERERAGHITREQIYTAAYLGDPPSQEALSDSLYDTTNQANDHICGICPCGWCRWEEGPDKWIAGLLTWGQNLPFKGIDEPHAEQEMAIRMGLALGEAVWDKLYTPEKPNGHYVLAERRASKFLAERTREARVSCRELWISEAWNGAPEWTHQVLYNIVDSAHRRQNATRWFVLSGFLLAGPCPECNVDNGWHSDCATCRSERQWKCPDLSQEVVRAALVPWVLEDAPVKV